MRSGRSPGWFARGASSPSSSSRFPLSLPFARLYLFYFLSLLPAIGRLVSGDGSAYSYLPESVLTFPGRDAFVARLERAGFAAATARPLSGGILALYHARRSA